MVLPLTSAPVISIVTLSFNQKKYLGECIYSVRTQKSDAVEYIVVDPGSTDGSRELIERNADYIDVAVLEPDEGPADGLNKGFARARGQIFGYINADDRLAPGALEFVADFFSRHPRIDVLCGAIGMIDGSGRPSVRSRTADLFDLTRYAAGICTVGQQGTFFRRKAFERAGGFNKLNRISWDGELLVDMALAGARFATARKILGDFRIYPESITGSQRHAELFAAEQRRLAEKIRASGCHLYSPPRRLASRLLYKANVLRHLGYVLVR
jgi:glycosyltransferase involved in cell wall biosynthesis